MCPDLPCLTGTALLALHHQDLASHTTENAISRAFSEATGCVEGAGAELFAFTGSGALTVCMFGASRSVTHESLHLKDTAT